MGEWQGACEMTRMRKSEKSWLPGAGFLSADQLGEFLAIAYKAYEAY